MRRGFELVRGDGRDRRSAALAVALILLQFVAAPLVASGRAGALATAPGKGAERRAPLLPTEEETHDPDAEEPIADRGRGIRLAGGHRADAAPAPRSSRHGAIAPPACRAPHPRGPLAGSATGGRAVRLLLQSHRC